MQPPTFSLVYANELGERCPWDISIDRGRALTPFPVADAHTAALAARHP